MILIGFNRCLKVSVQPENKKVQILKAKKAAWLYYFPLLLPIAEVFLLPSSSLKPLLRHCYVFVAMLSLPACAAKMTSLQAVDQNDTQEESSEL